MMIGGRWRRVWLAGGVAGAVVAVAVAAEGRDREEPGRDKAFLGRDSVVREAGVRTALVGGSLPPPLIVTGRDATAGPRETFENGQIDQAGQVLARYLRKITGVECAVRPARATRAIPDAGFEQPPVGASPNPEWPALAGQWITYLNRAGSGTATLTTNGVRSGRAALTARGLVPAGGIAGAYHPLALQTGQAYRLTLWYRAQLPEPGEAVVFFNPPSPATERVLPSAKEWNRVEIPFVASNTQAAVFVGLRNSRSSTNQVWFDDITLEKDGEVPLESSVGGRLFVGVAGDALAEFPELAKADAHGFVIARRGSDLYIVGRSGTATLYGVWFFLYNYAGLRIVMPGEIGEIYATSNRLAIAEDLYVFNPGPDYRMRIISQPNFDRLSWLMDASGTERFLYHHAFGRILPPSKFGQTHADLYPILGGKRFIPLNDKSSMWQPTFSEPKLVDHVLRQAEEEFTKNPQLLSVSVTANDGTGYSELDMTNGIAGWRRHYYAFVNAVARGVAQRWPGRYVAMLSYGDLTVPPESAMEDNVMLFLFSYNGNVQETYEQWKGKVANFGVYQWVYGGGWLLPSYGLHAMRDYLRFVRGIGGRAFKGEAGVAFAQDGLNFWVLANLLWNVDADVDALVADYLAACYGREAAPAMGRFYAQAEQIYERRRTPSQFNLTRHRVGPYQFQNATNEDFRLMDAAMEEAARQVRGEGNRTRLDYTRRCYEFCRLYWTAYRSLNTVKSLLAQAGTNGVEAATLLAEAEAFSKAVAAIPAYQAAQLAPLPPSIASVGILHEYWLGAGFKWREQHNVVVEGMNALTAARLKTEGTNQVDAFWKEAGERAPALQVFAKHQRWKLLPAGTPLRNLLSNGGFEEAVAAGAADQATLLERFRKWEYKYNDFNDLRYTGVPARDWVAFDRNGIELATARDETVTREGRASLRVAGAAYKGGILHHFEPPDSRARYRLSFWYKTRGDIGIGIGGVTYYKAWGSEEQYCTFGPAADWRRAEVEFTANTPPEQAACTFALFMQGSKPDAQVWFDDVRVEMLAPEGVGQAATPQSLAN